LLMGRRCCFSMSALINFLCRQVMNAEKAHRWLMIDVIDAFLVCVSSQMNICELSQSWTKCYLLLLQWSSPVWWCLTAGCISYVGLRRS
jgi:hypothetical protein